MAAVKPKSLGFTTVRGLGPCGLLRGGFGGKIPHDLTHEFQSMAGGGREGSLDFGSPQVRVPRGLVKAGDRCRLPLGLAVVQDESSGKCSLNRGMVVAGYALKRAGVGGAIGGAIVPSPSEADDLVEAGRMEAKVVDV